MARLLPPRLPFAREQPNTMTDRLYYRDCQLLDFAARVVSIEDVAGRPSVVLDRTAFYPTSGGQPFDTGTLGNTTVVDVVDAKDVILHVVDGSPPETGAEVTGRVDGERRRDHTQQHTGQHVLSQAFERTGGLRTVSFHLGADYCTIDLDTPSLEAAAAHDAEALANQVVLDGRPIVIHFAEATDLARYGLRKPTERSGTIRIVEIADFDRSACGGTHVEQTGQIGPIKIRRWERRGAETRVEFVCGWRALRDYADRLAATRALSERLSARDADLVASVGRALDDLDRLRDEVGHLRERLIDVEAVELLQSSTTLAGAESPRLVVRAFDNRSPDDLKRLALEVVKRDNAVTLFGSTGEHSHLVFAQRPGLPFDMGGLLRAVAPLIGGRGGGSRDLAQGGAPGGAAIAPALEAARQALLGK